jgi:hypothetical protein
MVTRTYFNSMAKVFFLDLERTSEQNSSENGWYKCIDVHLKETSTKSTHF